MNILVIGSGAREHTLVWKLSQSKHADKVYAVPGNPGMADLAECIDGVSITDNAALVKLAQEKNIGLAVVGPEVPLTNGAVDAFAAAGIKAFGPVQAAAEIEGSKAFSKDLMKRYNIPIENVIRHYDITGKLCPGLLGWNDEEVYDKNTGKKIIGKWNNSDEWLKFKKRLI